MQTKQNDSYEFLRRVGSLKLILYSKLLFDRIVLLLNFYSSYFFHLSPSPIDQLLFTSPLSFPFYIFSEKNKTSVLIPVWVFEGPLRRAQYLLSYSSEAPLFKRQVIYLYTLYLIFSEDLLFISSIYLNSIH